MQSGVLSKSIAEKLTRSYYGSRVVSQTHKDLPHRLGDILANLSEIASIADRCCEAGRQMLRAEGATITVPVEGGQMAWSSTDELSMRLVDLQDVVGQGPLLDSLRHTTVNVVAFDSVGDGRWPTMHDHALATSETFTGALITVPLCFAGRSVGVLSAHRQEALRDDDQDVGTFLSLALGGAVGQQRYGEAAAYELPRSWSSRAEIHLATGMVIAQAEVAPQDAMALLRGRAFAQEKSLVDIASLVISRDIHFRRSATRSD